MKAMYLLSDVEGHEATNFTVFPGSHLRRFPEDNSEGLTPHTPGAVQLEGKAFSVQSFALAWPRA